MKIIKRKFTKAVLLILLYTGFNQLHAQQLSIKDFVLFGKEKVQLSSSSTIIDGGKVGSNFLIKTTGTSTISSSLHSGNKIELANSNTVAGNITAANTGLHTGTSILIGSNAVISGSLDANGNIVINSGSVNGPIVSSGTYNGPQPTSGNTTQNGSPTIPVLPQLPELLVPINYGIINPDITNTATLSPGAYKKLTLNGNKTITFNGPGDYVFESILNSGNFNKFIFDFKGNINGAFRIFVTGNVDLNKILIEQINLPIANATTSDIAARVLMQVNGTGGTNGYAWSISNGASGSNQSNWYGTVIAANGSINVGSGSSLSKIIGGLWSGKTINIQSGVSITYVPLICSAADAKAGDDKIITCPGTQIIGTENSVGVSFKWTISKDGSETIVGREKTITVSNPGIYTLYASNNCGITTTDEVVVTYVSCVDPINDIDDGKVENILGHILTYLPTKLEESIKHIMFVGEGTDKVLIEAVAYVGFEKEARDTLWKYGMRDTIPNGINPLLITGSFPIANLEFLLQPGPAQVLNQINPVFIPLGNSGLTTSAGDTSVGANLVRSGFDVKGEGIKIGVISDSYNTLNSAINDVNNGDLPGDGNLDGYTTPVQIIQEFPWGARSDEGRAMMQIIHDLAPKANLAFRTGFISAGDFAYGILQLKDAGCKIIVDDVTYITEPFFKDGIVSKAIDMVTAEGVSYFTSAGNFGNKSYSSVFNPISVPGISGSAHNFSGGDVYQRLKLKSGTYTIVLQWQDDVYSLGTSTSGTLNDLDIYLVDPGGKIGFNRNNIGGDPLEVLSFSINLPDPNQTIDADLLIVKAGAAPGAVNPNFKYVIFRGDAVIDEYHSSLPLQNKSTIVGHANSQNAISVGAVLWSNSPAFGVTEPTIASFSSTGGTPVYTSSGAVVRPKPELTAPNGVNTTVFMGRERDESGFFKFFGTSAAAPHAAAVAALVLDARKKYYDQTLTPGALKNVLLNSAIPMQPDGIVGGVNYKAGRGLVHADLAIRSFANPTPVITSLEYEDGIIPGESNFTVTVTGEHLTSNSVIYFNGLPIQNTQVNTELNKLTGVIEPFTGNPPLTVFNASFNGTNNNGGFSNTLYFFDAVKLPITIVADNKTKLYGEELPEFTATIFVNGDSLHVYNQNNGTSLSRSDLGVDNLTFRYADATLNSLTNTGTYQIRVSRSFELENVADQQLLEKYNYDSTFGFIQISPLPVTVAPRDTTIIYGSAISNIQFNYTLPDDVNITNPADFLNVIKTEHQNHLANDVIAFANGVPVAIVNGLPVPVVNVMINGIPVAVVNGVPVSLVNGVPVSIVNGSTVVTVNNQEFPVVNGQSIIIVNGSPLVLANVLANGVPVAIVNGVPVAFVNAVPVSYVNGVPVSYVNGVPVSYVNSIVNGVPVAIVNGVPVSYVNSIGTEALENKGFMATSNAIENARTIINTININGTATTQTTKIVDLTQQSLFSFSTDPDASETTIVNSKAILNLQQLVNGIPVAYVNGLPVPIVNGVPVSIVNGVPVAVVNGVPVSIVNSETKVPVIIDSEDLPGGIESLKSVNVISGINTGIQTIIPGALLSNNFLVQYSTATLTILPAPITIKARDTSKVFGDELELDETKFLITSGSLRNGDEITSVKLTSTGVSSSAEVGTYPIVPSDAVGSTTTDLSNYIITYQNGILSVNCDGPTSQCTIPTSFTNDVVLSGNKKWTDILPRISPDNITGTIRIRGSGTLTVSNKNLLLKSNKAILVIEGITLIVDNGNFGLDNSYSKVIITNASVRVSGNFYQNTFTQLCISNSEVEVGDELSNGIFSLSGAATTGDFLNNGGYRYMNNVCLNVTKNLQLSSAGNGTVSGGGLDVFVYVKGEIGDQGAKNACTGLDNADNGSWQNNKRQEIYCSEFHVSDNIQNSSSSTMVVKGADFRTLKGNFENSGTINGSGLNLAINNQILNAGTWSAGVDMWYAASTSGTLSIGPKTNSLQAVLDVKFDCGCNSTSSTEIITAASRSITAIENDANKLPGIYLYPNPASSFVTVSFVPEKTGRTTLTIMSMDGRKVIETFNGITEAGITYNKQMNINDLPAGLYMIQLRVDNDISVKKLLITKN